MRFSNDQVALVTGAASGIGRGISEVLSREGVKIIVADIDTKQGLNTAEKIKNHGGDALFVQMDVTNSQQIKDAITMVVERYGKIDILVNNAGIALSHGPVSEVEEVIWDKIMGVNLKGVFLCSKFTIPEMRKRGKGAIVNIASVDGLWALPNAAPYCASKGGVIALTKAMALDCAPFGIRVNCICPGAVLTPLQERFYAEQTNPQRTAELYSKGYPIGRIGTPVDIGNLVAYLSSDESSYVTGSIFVIDGGMHAQYGEAILDKIVTGFF
jgi:NAD(P)-dependent dehydrogenase (short-subunit alcohol dehydrogenase family)